MFPAFCIVLLGAAVATAAPLSPYSNSPVPAAWLDEKLAPSVALFNWTRGTATLFGGPQDGQDTAYNVSISGSCGYGPSDPSIWPFAGIVGVGPTSILATARPNSGCGTCIAIKCVDTRPRVCLQSPRGDPPPVLLAQVTTTCPECEPDHINLHAFGYQTIARTFYGIADVAYKQVPCEALDGITVRVDAWRARWLRIVLLNVAGDGGIASVNIRASADPRSSDASDASTSGNASTTKAGAAVADSLMPPKAAGPWNPMQNAWGAAWEGHADLGSAPFGFDLQVTSILGEVVTLRRVIPASSAPQDSLHDYYTDVQFKNNGTLAARLVRASQLPVKPSPRTSTDSTVASAGRNLQMAGASPKSMRARMLMQRGRDVLGV